MAGRTFQGLLALAASHAGACRWAEGTMTCRWARRWRRGWSGWIGGSGWRGGS